MRLTIFILTITLVTSTTISFAQFRKSNSTSQVRSQTNPANHQTKTSKKKKTHKLKIDNIDRGYDSMQIRTWYAYSFVEKQKLILLVNKSKRWTGTLYIVPNGSNTNDIIEFVSKKTLKPRSGWDNYIQNLIKLNVLTLPNLNDIPGFAPTWFDGWTCTFEVAIKNQYHKFEYCLPEKYQKFWQSKNVVEILELNKKEFGIDWQSELE